AALIVSMTLTSIPAAEDGAGPHHLLPYLPSLFWALFVMRRATSDGLGDAPARTLYDRVSLGLVVALVIGYGPIVLGSWGRTFHGFANTPIVEEGIAEIDRALADNPGIKLAVGPGQGSFDAERL